MAYGLNSTSWVISVCEDRSLLMRMSLCLQVLVWCSVSSNFFVVTFIAIVIQKISLDVTRYHHTVVDVCVLYVCVFFGRADSRQTKFEFVHENNIGSVD